MTYYTLDYYADIFWAFGPMLVMVLGLGWSVMASDFGNRICRGVLIALLVPLLGAAGTREPLFRFWRDNCEPRGWEQATNRMLGTEDYVDIPFWQNHFDCHFNDTDDWIESVRAESRKRG